MFGLFQVTTGSTYSILGYVRVFEYDETSSLNINVDNQHYGPNKWKRLGPDLNPDNSEFRVWNISGEN